MKHEPGADVPEAVSRIPVQALTMAIPTIIFCVTALSIALTAAVEFGLTERQTASLIIALYGIPGLLSLGLTFAFRQPILVAWSTVGIIFLAAQAAEFTYSEVVGAMVVSGALLLVLGWAGLVSRLVTLIPAPIVYGVLAGLVMPYVVRAFSEGGNDVTMIGATIAAFFIGRRVLPPQLPPLLLALVVGLGVAAVTGQMQAPSQGWSLATPALVTPTFSPAVILTIAPVMFVMIVFQANVPAIVYLRSQEYRPPERLIDTATAASTMFGSLLGATPIAMAAFLTPLTAGPDAGPRHQRQWSVYVSATALVLIALAASLAADLPSVIPLSLLLTLAGLALSGVLAQALTEITRGPLRLGPLFAFVVASSQMTLMGLGPVFWAIAIGMAVSLLLEQESLASSRTSA